MKLPFLQSLVDFGPKKINSDLLYIVTGEFTFFPTKEKKSLFKLDQT